MNPEPHFNGPDYEPELDFVRLTGQIQRIRDLMMDGKWRTLCEIAQETNDPESSVSAQLRHLRKKRFGSYLVEKRRRGHPGVGLFEYRVSRVNWYPELSFPIRTPVGACVVVSEEK